MAAPHKAAAPTTRVQADHTHHLQYPAFVCSTGCERVVPGCPLSEDGNPIASLHRLFTALQEWVSAIKCKECIIPSPSSLLLFLLFSLRQKGIKGSIEFGYKNWEKEARNLYST